MCDEKIWEIIADIQDRITLCYSVKGDHALNEEIDAYNNCVDICKNYLERGKQ